jgi:hypothetical protein
MHSALLGPATRPPHLGSRPRPGPGLSFGLIHPRPPPFTDVHSDRVRAVGGRWRTPVNAMQQCWKACWGQPLRSSNLLSSATLICKNFGSWQPAPEALHGPWAHLWSHVLSAGQCHRQDEHSYCAWSRSLRTDPHRVAHAAEACALPFRAGRDRSRPAGYPATADHITLSDREVP